MKKLLCLPAGMLLVIILLSSCKKQPLDNLSGDETGNYSGNYITNYDTTADFTAYKTFAISDSVDFIQDNELFGRELISFDTIVFNTITGVMRQRGYQPVDKSAHPDLAINVSRVYSDYTGVLSYTDYWNDYHYYFDPYYWGHGGYGYYSPYSAAIYTIENGALSIDLLDLKNVTANGGRIKSIWSGLARGEGAFNTMNVVAETEALFDQSAYLKVRN